MVKSEDSRRVFSRTTKYKNSCELQQSEIKVGKGTPVPPRSSEKGGKVVSKGEETYFRN